MSTAQTASGHCLCRAVKYTVSGKLRPIIYCHCEQCRRSSGHYVAASACRSHEIAIDGEENIRWFRASETARRGFCRHCGSNLFWRPEDGDYTSIWAGSLDRPTGLRAAAHIHVHMASDYYDICDGLPTYEEDYPPYFPDGPA